VGDSEEDEDSANEVPCLSMANRRAASASSAAAATATVLSRSSSDDDDDHDNDDDDSDSNIDSDEGEKSQQSARATGGGGGGGHGRKCGGTKGSGRGKGGAGSSSGVRQRVRRSLQGTGKKLAERYAETAAAPGWESLPPALHRALRQVRVVWCALSPHTRSQLLVRGTRSTVGVLPCILHTSGTEHTHPTPSNHASCRGPSTHTRRRCSHLAYRCVYDADGPQSLQCLRRDRQRLSAVQHLTLQGSSLAHPETETCSLTFGGCESDVRAFGWVHEKEELCLISYQRRTQLTPFAAFLQPDGTQHLPPRSGRNSSAALTF
jgi:hypothetical protein